MNNPSKEAVPRDILYGKNNKNIRGVMPHFIIYMGPDENSDEQFIGAMLISSSRFSNIGLEKTHFEEYGNNWQVTYKKVL